MNTQHPVTVTSASVLLALLSLFSVLAGVMPAAIQPPPFILYASLVLGIGGLIAVVGLWRLNRWGRRLSLLISVMSSLLAAPGLVLAPPGVGKGISLGLVVLYALVLVLVALPATRKAFASERVRVVA